MKALLVAVSAIVVLLVSTPAAAGEAVAVRGQSPVAQLDIKKIQRFCDIGFRFTESGIKFDVEKLLSLGIDRKLLQAVDSQAALQIAVLTHACRLFAAGFITAEKYLETVTAVLQYGADLQAVREQAEKLEKAPVSQKAPELDPTRVAKAELGLTIVSSIDLGGQVQVVLRRLSERYGCVCLPEKR